MAYGLKPCSCHPIRNKNTGKLKSYSQTGPYVLMRWPRYIYFPMDECTQPIRSILIIRPWFGPILLYTEKQDKTRNYGLCLCVQKVLIKIQLSQLTLLKKNYYRKPNLEFCWETCNPFKEILLSNCIHFPIIYWRFVISYQL